MEPPPENDPTTLETKPDSEKLSPEKPAPAKDEKKSRKSLAQAITTLEGRVASIGEKLKAAQHQRTLVDQKVVALQTTLSEFEAYLEEIS